MEGYQLQKQGEKLVTGSLQESDQMPAVMCTLAVAVETERGRQRPDTLAGRIQSWSTRYTDTNTSEGEAAIGMKIGNSFLLRCRSGIDYYF